MYSPKFNILVRKSSFKSLRASKEMKKKIVSSTAEVSKNMGFLQLLRLLRK